MLWAREINAVQRSAPKRPFHLTDATWCLDLSPASPVRWFTPFCPSRCYNAVSSTVSASLHSDTWIVIVQGWSPFVRRNIWCQKWLKRAGLISN